MVPKPAQQRPLNWHKLDHGLPFIQASPRNLFLDVLSCYVCSTTFHIVSVNKSIPCFTGHHWTTSGILVTLLLFLFVFLRFLGVYFYCSMFVYKYGTYMRRWMGFVFFQHWTCTVLFLFLRAVFSHISWFLITFMEFHSEEKKQQHSSKQLKCIGT